METSLSTQTTARVYVNLPEGNSDFIVIFHGFHPFKWDFVRVLLG
jgi:hypothetical protein